MRSDLDAKNPLNTSRLRVSYSFAIAKSLGCSGCLVRMPRNQNAVTFAFMLVSYRVCEPGFSWTAARLPGIQA